MFLDDLSRKRPQPSIHQSCWSSALHESHVPTLAYGGTFTGRAAERSNPVKMPLHKDMKRGRLWQCSGRAKGSTESALPCEGEPWQPLASKQVPYRKVLPCCLRLKCFSFWGNTWEPLDGVARRMAFSQARGRLSHGIYVPSFEKGFLDKASYCHPGKIPPPA